MGPVEKLVEALNELANTGRISPDTQEGLADLVSAERFNHPIIVEAVNGSRSDTVRS